MKANLLKRYEEKIEDHATYLMKVLLTDLERELAADQLVVTLVQQRFINGVAADVRAWLQRETRQSPQRRLSRVAAETVAGALTEPLRGSAYRVLGAAVRRRAMNPTWARDANEYQAAVAELVEKRLRAIVARHVQHLTENLRALLPLLLQTESREE